jgi:CheY-specific phosphatase CheX
MSTDNITTLGEVTVEILERFAFMLGDPTEEKTAPALPAAAWMATMQFIGPRRGTLGLATTAAFAHSMAANLFGREPGEVNDEEAADALKEFLNVTCGDYLHELEGNEPIYDLSAPVVVPADRAALQARLAGRPQFALNVEGQPLFVFLGD